jgi:hypothetical protein
MDDNLLKKLGLDVNKVIYSDNGETYYDGDIDLRLLNLKEIPVKFDKVFGDFLISSNKITTLENSPKFVGGDFGCGFNLLKDLKFAPCMISGKFYVAYNKLESISGIPRIIGGHIYLHENQKKFTWHDVDDEIQNKNGKIGGKIYTEDQMDNREETMIYIKGKFNPRFSHLLKKSE